VVPLSSFSYTRFSHIEISAHESNLQPPTAPWQLRSHLTPMRKAP
jgi:hypothetical protein